MAIVFDHVPRRAEPVDRRHSVRRCRRRSRRDAGADRAASRLTRVHADLGVRLDVCVVRAARSVPGGRRSGHAVARRAATRAHRYRSHALPPPTSRLPACPAATPTLGFTHILPKGLDHVLFVLGVFLLSRKWIRPILMQVSAFTDRALDHARPEHLRAGVGVAVDRRAADRAVDRLHRDREPGAQSEMRPWRVGLVFAFGLLHGLGFAGALRKSACRDPSS